MKMFHRRFLVFCRNYCLSVARNIEHRSSIFSWQYVQSRKPFKLIKYAFVIPYTQVASSERFENETITVIANFLNENPEKTKKLVSGNVDLALTTTENTQRILQILNENKITSTTLKKNLYLLQLDWMELKEKLQLIDQLPFTLSKALPLTKLNQTQLHHLLIIAKTEKTLLDGNNRIQWLCEKFKLSEEEVLKSVAKFPFFLYIELQRLQIVANILLDYQVEKDNILNDFWVFRTSVKVMLSRFEIAKNAGVQPIKTWMSRCPEKILQKAIERQRKNKQVCSGDEATVADYLSSRLSPDGTSKEMIHFIVNKKYPQLQRMNLFRVKEIADFLVSKDYTATDILLWPRIFFAKIKTIDERLARYKKINMSKPKLVQLCKSRKQFEQELEHFSKKLQKP